MKHDEGGWQWVTNENNNDTRKRGGTILLDNK